MDADHVTLKEAWQNAMRESGELDPLNRWLVVREVAISSTRAEGTLTTHGGDPESLEDARQYASHAREQDVLTRAMAHGKSLWDLVGAATVLSMIAGGIAGLVKVFKDAETAGQSVDLTPVVGLLAAQGAILFFVIRALAQAAGPIAKELGDALSDAMRSARPAQNIVQTFKASERAFFSVRGARAPWHWMVHSVGPGFTLFIIAIIAFPVGLVVFFLYGSLGVTTEQMNPGSTFP